MTASLLALLALPVLAGPPVLAGAPVVVVTAAAETESLSHKEAKQLFTGRKTAFDNGVTVTLMLPHPTSAEMIWLADSVLGLPADIYQRFLAEQAYRRGDPPPLSLPDASAAVAAARAQRDGTSILTVVSKPPDAPLLGVNLQP
jgi:hypothetical protein